MMFVVGTLLSVFLLTACLANPNQRQIIELRNPDVNQAISAGLIGLLHEFYDSLGGANWNCNSKLHCGSKWDFAKISSANPNNLTEPCTKSWMGLNCSSSSPGSWSIREISFVDNNLAGIIPASISSLSTLQVLVLKGSGLRGTIPSTLGLLTRLTSLTISGNSLERTIPSQLDNLVQLSSLSFAGNGLTGSIPSNLGLLSLTSLYIEGAKLVGHLFPFQNSLNSARMTSLSLLCGNCKPAPFPTELQFLSNLKTLSLVGSHISGSLPPFLGDFSNIELLNLANNSISGLLPSSLFALKGLKALDLSRNQFHGTISSSVAALTNIESLILGLNSFSGILPKSFLALSRLQYFVIANNNLEGKLDGVFNPDIQSDLIFIDISSNQFTGEIPREIFAFTKLETFAASVNCFHGRIRTDICQLTNLRNLFLNGVNTASSCQAKYINLSGYTSAAYYTRNKIRGTIPPCLFELPQLESMHLANNGINGAFPVPTKISPSLKSIGLGNNYLTGEIPMVLQTFGSWEFLDISFNRLTGILSSDFQTNSSRPVTLKARVNRLSGRIPPQLLDMSDIDILYGNVFTCDVDSKELFLPANDPFTDKYQCGSNDFNYSIIPWCCLLAISFAFMVTAVYFELDIYLDARQAWLAAYGITLKIWNVTDLIGKSTDHDFKNTDNVNLNRFGLEMERFRRSCSLIVVILLLLYFPLYGVLSMYSWSVKYRYGYTVSAIFLGGDSAGIVLWVMFFFFMITSSIVWVNRQGAIYYHGKEKVAKVKVVIPPGGSFLDVQHYEYGEVEVDEVRNAEEEAVKDKEVGNPRSADIADDCPERYSNDLGIDLISTRSRASSKVSSTSSKILSSDMDGNLYFKTEQGDESFRTSNPALSSKQSSVAGSDSGGSASTPKRDLRPSTESFKGRALAALEADPGHESPVAIDGEALIIELDRDCEEGPSNVVAQGLRNKMKKEKAANFFQRMTSFDDTIATISYYSSFTSMVLANIIIMVCINVAFVEQTAKYEGSVNLINAITASVSLFKSIWTWGVVPAAIDFHRVSFADFSKEGVFLSRTILMLFTAIVNIIVIPVLVVMATTSTCFNYVFTNPPNIDADLHYGFCPYANVSTSTIYGSMVDNCYSNDLRANQLSPFAYNYQCGSTLVSQYAKIYVFQFITETFVFPGLRVIQFYFRHNVADFKQTVIAPCLESLKMQILIWRYGKSSNYLKDGSSFESTSNGQLGDSGRKNPFKRDLLVVKMFTILGIILTFGVVFPPLTILGLLAIFSLTYSTQLSLAQQWSDALAAEDLSHIKDIMAVSRNLFALIWQCSLVLLPLAFPFYSLFVFDVFGRFNALWAPLTLLLFPVPMCYIILGHIYVQFRTHSILKYESKFKAGKGHLSTQPSRKKLKSPSALDSTDIMLEHSSTLDNQPLALGTSNDSADDANLFDEYPSPTNVFNKVASFYGHDDMSDDSTDDNLAIEQRESEFLPRRSINGSNMSNSSSLSSFTRRRGSAVDANLSSLTDSGPLYHNGSHDSLVQVNADQTTDSATITPVKRRSSLLVSLGLEDILRSGRKESDLPQ